MTFPTPTGTNVLLDPIYDPVKVGSIYMPPAAQNMAPSHGHVVAVGQAQTEVEVGYRVLVSTMRFSESKLWYDRHRDHEYYIVEDDEIIAFITSDAQVFPRKNYILVRPDWREDSPTEHSGLISITRLFTSPPPNFATVIRVGSEVTTIHRGQVVLLPPTGGNALGIRDRVLYSIKADDIPGIVEHAI